MSALGIGGASRVQNIGRGDVPEGIVIVYWEMEGGGICGMCSPYVEHACPTAKPSASHAMVHDTLPCALPDVWNAIKAYEHMLTLF